MLGVVSGAGGPPRIAGSCLVLLGVGPGGAGDPPRFDGGPLGLLGLGVGVPPRIAGGPPVLLGLVLGCWGPPHIAGGPPVLQRTGPRGTGIPCFTEPGVPYIAGGPLVLLGVPLYCWRWGECLCGQLCGAGLWVTAAPRAEWGPQGHGRERAWLW